MSNSLFQVLNISRQDMLSRLLELDTTSNNLANINTVGFKSTRSNFQELLNKAQTAGVYLPTTQLMTEQGTLRSTGNALDLGLTGEGYFQVRMPDGSVGYTRDGQFTLDSSLNIVNASGMKLVWQGTVAPASEEIKVEQNGKVLTRIGTTWTQAGQIQLARFTNPSALYEKGKNVFQPNKNSGAAQLGNPGTAPFGQIQAGNLEQSNVNSAEEMTRLMMIQRDFQISTRVFQTTDQMIAQAIQMRRI
jgi:flagellar basal-body rod protein FlgG